jgi:hypothetical protein
LGILIFHLICGDWEHRRLVEKFVHASKVFAARSSPERNGTAQRAAPVHFVRIANHFLEFARRYAVPREVLFKLVIPNEKVEWHNAAISGVAIYYNTCGYPVKTDKRGLATSANAGPGPEGLPGLRQPPLTPALSRRERGRRRVAPTKRVVSGCYWL